MLLLKDAQNQNKTLTAETAYLHNLNTKRLQRLFPLKLLRCKWFYLRDNKSKEHYAIIYFHFFIQRNTLCLAITI